LSVHHLATLTDNGVCTPHTQNMIHLKLIEIRSARFHEFKRQIEHSPDLCWLGRETIQQFNSGTDNSLMHDAQRALMSILLTAESRQWHLLEEDLSKLQQIHQETLQHQHAFQEACVLGNQQELERLWQTGTLINYRVSKIDVIDLAQDSSNALPKIKIKASSPLEAAVHSKQHTSAMFLMRLFKNPRIIVNYHNIMSLVQKDEQAFELYEFMEQKKMITYFHESGEFDCAWVDKNYKLMAYALSKLSTDEKREALLAKASEAREKIKPFLIAFQQQKRAVNGDVKADENNRSSKLIA